MVNVIAGHQSGPGSNPAATNLKPWILFKKKKKCSSDVTNLIITLHLFDKKVAVRAEIRASADPIALRVPEKSIVNVLQVNGVIISTLIASEWFQCWYCSIVGACRCGSDCKCPPTCPCKSSCCKMWNERIGTQTDLTVCYSLWDMENTLQRSHYKYFSWLIVVFIIICITK